MFSKQKRSNVAISIMLLLVVALSSGLVYYASAVASANARISSLQQSVSELEGQALLPQLQGNTSAMGLDPTAIYASSNDSVVTVQGSRIVTVLTVFGPQPSVESVLGSGFVTQNSQSYYVVTNFHVIDSMVNVTVTFWNGQAYPATLVGSDPYSDIAVLSTKAPTNEFHPLVFVSSSSLKVGQPVVAIGNPFGLSGSVTFGIISQTGRTIQYQSTTATFTIADAIQFSAPINPGNSGGPLLNAYGFVAGITSAAVTGSQGVGFAIPSDTIRRELPDLIRTGGFNKHPYVGIQGSDMNYAVAQAIGTNFTYGVLVEKTAPGGPADAAGLRGGTQSVAVGTQTYLIGGDVIVSMNGARIVSYDSLETYLERNVTPGQTVKVGIIREGQYSVLQVTVGTLPLS
jgi:S1-C subfamily serine protease